MLPKEQVMIIFYMNFQTLFCLISIHNIPLICTINDFFNMYFKLNVKFLFFCF